MVAGGTQRNHAYLSDLESGLPSINWGSLSESEQFFLADAQTSGGLLFAVEPDRANALITALKEHGTLAAAIIGKCVAGEAGAISITE
jgi:selenide,water dikinase